MLRSGFLGFLTGCGCRDGVVRCSRWHAVSGESSEAVDRCSTSTVVHVAHRIPPTNSSASLVLPPLFTPLKQ